MYDSLCSNDIYAMQMTGTILDSHRQPWLNRDIHQLLAEERNAAVRGGNFVGLHVRRGDKVAREAKLVEVEASMSTRMSSTKYT